jgi:hypothetical protein
VAVSDGCFGANQTLQQVFESTPVNLGTTQSDGAGRYSNSIKVPLGADPGTHRIVTTGSDGKGGTHRSVGTLTVPNVNCTDFTYREDAQAVLDANKADPHGLDTDRDGRACESLPTRVGGLSVTGPGQSTRTLLLTGGLAILLGSVLVLAGRRPWIVVSEAASHLNRTIERYERR